MDRLRRDALERSTREWEQQCAVPWTYQGTGASAMLSILGRGPWRETAPPPAAAPPPPSTSARPAWAPTSEFPPRRGGARARGGGGGARALEQLLEAQERHRQEVSALQTQSDISEALRGPAAADGGARGNPPGGPGGAAGRQRKRERNSTRRSGYGTECAESYYRTKSPGEAAQMGNTVRSIRNSSERTCSDPENHQQLAQENEEMAQNWRRPARGGACGRIAAGARRGGAPRPGIAGGGGAWHKSPRQPRRR